VKLKIVSLGIKPNRSMSQQRQQGRRWKALSQWWWWKKCKNGVYCYL